jgi:hypothetical protein
MDDREVREAELEDEEQPTADDEDVQPAETPAADDGMPLGRFVGAVCGIAGLVLALMTVSQMLIDRGPRNLSFVVFVAALGLLFVAATLLLRRPRPEDEGPTLPPPEGKPFLDDLVCSECGAPVSNAPECPECGHRGRMTKARYERMHPGAT